MVVLPRAANSTQVLVAHLGRMSLANKPGPPSRTTYRVRVRDISLATVSTLLVRRPGTLTWYVDLVSGPSRNSSVAIRPYRNL